MNNNSRTRKATAAIAVAAASAGLFLSACSDKEKEANDAVSAAASSIGAAASSVQQQVQSAIETAGQSVPDSIEEGKVLAWVTAFKTGYPTLAQGRDDAAIKSIRVDVCKDVKAGKSADEVTKKLEDLAANSGVKPNSYEAQALYLTLTGTC